MSDFIKPGYKVSSDDIVLANPGSLAGALTGDTTLEAALTSLDTGSEVPSSFSFSIAAAGANVSEVTITAKDGGGNTLTGVKNFLCWLSDSATGVDVTGTTASGTVTAKTASGSVLVVLTAKKAILAQTKSDGTFILEITDTSKTHFYVCAMPFGSGVSSISTQLATNSYGS